MLIWCRAGFWTETDHMWTHCKTIKLPDCRSTVGSDKRTLCDVKGKTRAGSFANLGVTHANAPALPSNDFNDCDRLRKRKKSVINVNDGCWGPDSAM